MLLSFIYFKNSGAVLRIEARAPYVLGKHSLTLRRPQPVTSYQASGPREAAVVHLPPRLRPQLVV